MGSMSAGRAGRLVGRVALVALLVGLAACNPFKRIAKIGGTCNDPKPYMAAKSVPALQIPSGMDAPDTGSALKIPRLNEPQPPKRGEKDPCLDDPPPFVIPKKPTPQA